MRIRRTYFFEKLGSPSSLLQNGVLIGRSLRPAKRFRGTMRKWGKKKNGKRKGKWCLAWAILRKGC